MLEKPPQEFPGGRRAGSDAVFRLPLKAFQVDPAAEADHDVLGDEPFFLLLETPAAPEGDPAPAVDHAMPGKSRRVRGGMEDPGDAPSSPLTPGQGGDLAVGRDPAAGNGPDNSLRLARERRFRTGAYFVILIEPLVVSREISGPP
jgi:hypothetical protein